MKKHCLQTSRLHHKRNDINLSSELADINCLRLHYYAFLPGEREKKAHNLAHDTNVLTTYVYIYIFQDYLIETITLSHDLINALRPIAWISAASSLKKGNIYNKQFTTRGSTRSIKLNATAAKCRGEINDHQPNKWKPQARKIASLQQSRLNSP